MSANTKPKKYRSKFFRIAMEGDTSDGRVIERQHLEEMASTYNPALYGARIWPEHFRGLLAGGPFDALGDVIALKAEEFEIEIAGQKQKKMGLYAQIDPTAPFVEMVNNLRQKVYTSMELSVNFAKTGKAYLVGLGATDSPGSLGTEMLQFAQQNPESNPLKGRKQDPNNLFTAFVETGIELEEIEAPVGVVEAFFTRLEKLMGKETPAPQDPPAPAPQPNNAGIQQFSELIGAMKDLGTIQAEQFAKLEQRFATADANHKALQDNFNAFKSQLESTPAGHQASRPAATGATGANRTDC